jgi:hypothetical protein
LPALKVWANDDPHSQEEVCNFPSLKWYRFVTTLNLSFKICRYRYMRYFGVSTQGKFFRKKVEIRTYIK